MTSRMRGSTNLFILFLGATTALASVLLFVLQPEPLLALLPPVLLPVLVVLWHRPEYGYYLILAFVPLDTWRNLFTEDYPFLSVSKVVGAWILLVILVKEASKSEVRDSLKTPMWFFLAAFVGVVIVSSALSEWFLATVLQFRKLLTGYLMFGLTLYFFIQRRHFRLFFPAVLIASTTLCAALGIVGNLFEIDSLTMEGTGAVEERIVGVAADPNFFAAMLLCGIPFIAYFFFSARTIKMRLLMAILFMHNSAAILITYSRAVTLIYILTILLITLEYILRLRPRHLGFVLLAVGIVAAYGFTELTGTDFWKRMETLSNPDSDFSILRRLSYLKVAEASFEKHPLLGTGLGTFPLIYETSPYATAFAIAGDVERRYAHNTYLEVLVGTGLLGLLCFLLAIFLAARYLFIAQNRLRKRDRDGACYVRVVGYAFISFLFSLVFLSDLYHKYLWIFLALSVVAYRHSEKTDETS